MPTGLLIVGANAVFCYALLVDYAKTNSYKNAK
jgi:hypothetical protein